VIDVVLWLVVFALDVIVRGLCVVAVWYAFCFFAPREAKDMAAAAARVADKRLRERSDGTGS
jgi:uncharacterized protein YjeT (DUF2065 family)